MKILGKTNDGFILGASKSEIANLIGYYSEYDSTISNLTIGDDVQVHRMFQKLYDLVSRKKNIREAKKHVQELLELLDETIPVLNTIPDKDTP